VVVVLAVVVYLLVIPTSQKNEDLLGRLVIGRSSAPGVPSKPSGSQAVPPSTSTFGPVKQAAKGHPGQTGIYEREWDVTASAPPEAGLILEYLPDDSSAAATEAVVRQKVLSKAPTSNGETSSAPKRFAIPGVAGATAVSYALTDAATKKPAGFSYATDFRSGRAVVDELMVTTSASRSTAAAIEDAQAEHALLLREAPGFSLSPTRYPTVASIVFVIIALLVVLAAYFGPELAVSARDRQRAHREAKHQEQIRSQYRARGRRAVARHRAPAWRQRQGARR